MQSPTKQYSDFFTDFSAMLAQENVQIIENTLGAVWLEQALEEYYEMEPWISLLERNIWTVDNNLNIPFNGAGTNNPILAWNNSTQYGSQTTPTTPWQILSYGGNYYVVLGYPTVGTLPTNQTCFAQIIYPLVGNNVIAIWNNTSTFPAGILVNYQTNGLYYQCLGNPPAGGLPTDGTYWSVVLVPTDTIRKLWTVSENDPLNPSGGTLLNGNYQGNTYSVIMVEGQEVPGGVFLPSRSPGDQLWCQYTPERSATFSGQTWVSGQAYAVGAQTYYDPALGFYKAINAVTSSTSPDQDPTNWAVVTMPREIYPFVRDTAVANYLASMKNERYAFYQQRAEMFMLDRKMAILRNPFSQPQQIVKTHATERRSAY